MTDRKAYGDCEMKMKLSDKSITADKNVTDYTFVCPNCGKWLAGIRSIKKQPPGVTALDYGACHE